MTNGYIDQTTTAMCNIIMPFEFTPFKHFKNMLCQTDVFKMCQLRAIKSFCLMTMWNVT